MELNRDTLPTTAVLLFSRTPTDEAIVKTFDAKVDRRTNAAIARQLIQHSIATVGKSQLPLFPCFSTAQAGATFGERLANAIEATFAQGFNSVIAIGNDCPELTVRHLRQAKHQLAQRELVLGPAADGGLYLIGMQRSAYRRELFVGLPWETNQLQSAWCDYAADCATSPILWLSEQRDIDDKLAFARFLRKQLGLHALRKRLLALVQHKSTNKPTYHHFYQQEQQLILSPFRGPPYKALVADLIK